MKLRSRLPPLSPLPMTTMADVAFLLIIFFMLTSTFARDTGLDITLPKAMTSEKLPKREITIWVNRQGQVRVNENWIEPKQLMGMLRAEFAKADVTGVTIRGDERVPYGTIVTVMDTAKLLGADITLAAEVEEGHPGAVVGEP
ncbi:MAG: ExbD/TolR family protein [Armatimonadota bacterium]